MKEKYMQEVEMRNMDNPDLSIVIPVYNAESTLDRCLQSIIELDVNKEIILVNDGSADNSLIICTKYSEIYDCIAVVNQQNQGPSAARNVGIKKAKGKYLYFVDADDYIEPRNLEPILYRCIRDDLEAALFDYEIDNEQGFRLCRYKADLIDGHVYSGPLMMETIDVQAMVWLYIIKRSFITDRNIFFCEGLFHEDGAFVMRWMPFANRIGYISKTVYHYVQTADSIMRTRSIKRSQDLVEISKVVYGYADEYMGLLPEKTVNKVRSYSSYYSFIAICNAVRDGYRVSDLIKNMECRAIIVDTLKNSRYRFFGFLAKNKMDGMIEVCANAVNRLRK